jgi:hypothetical protein
VSKILVAPLEALTDPELTDRERRVLLVLFSFRGKVTQNVWPSRELIGERANIKDLSSVGKRTTALCKKGWLIKYKKGFSGHMTYILTFPERLNTPQDSIGQPLEVKSASNDETPLIDSSLEVKLASHLRSNQPPPSGSNRPSALNKPLEQTIQQTIYKKITLENDDPLIDVYKEFIDHRIALKFPLSQSTFDRFLGVVQTCVDQLSVDPGWVITETIDAGWRSCKPEWIANRNRKNSAVPARTINSDSMRQQSIQHQLEDRSWAE